MLSHAPLSQPSGLRVLAALGAALLLAVLMSSCGGSNGDGADDSTGTQPVAVDGTATPASGDDTDDVSPAPGGPEELINIVCPPQDPIEDDGYCEFIVDIEAGLAEGERPGIVSDLSGRPVQCPDAGDVCGGADEAIEIIQFTQNNEGSELAVEDARARIHTLLDGADAEASDERGGGELSLFAIATGMTEVRDKAMVFTGIGGGAEEGRFILMLILADDSGAWRTGAVNVVTGGGVEDFLTEIERRQSAGSFWKWQLSRTIEHTGE